MLARVFAVAGFMAVAGGGAGLAQSDGPAELPAADYQGQSYVDSAGCIFLKAGYGGDATWVARLDPGRKPVCGQTPTKAVAMVADAAATTSPATPKPRPAKRHVQAQAPAQVMIGCPVSVPVARRYATTDGGSVVICTATNGSLTGARSPIYPAGSGVGAALSAKPYPGVTIPLPQGQVASVQANGTVLLPPGYEAAWKDDRLNPLRGKGLAQGQAAQDKLSTRDVPAQDLAVAAKPAMGAAPARPTAAVGGTYYVQVGVFAGPTNADAASARLMAIGLPVSKGKFSKQGKALQVILAGPFTSGAEAQAALARARTTGFADAYLRQSDSR